MSGPERQSESFVGKPLTPEEEQEMAKRKAEADKLSNKERQEVRDQLIEAVNLGVIPRETPKKFLLGRDDEKKRK